jgi:hypothetical protein
MQLLALAGGDLPLALVPELLTGVSQQDACERENAEGEVIGRLLLERDQKLLGLLRKEKAGASLVQKVTDYLARDREERQPPGLSRTGCLCPRVPDRCCTI